MKRTLAALALLLPVFAAHAQQPKQDLNFQQSPLKPAPDWVKLVDHGQDDSRLKGYFAPDGLKIDIVADALALNCNKGDQDAHDALVRQANDDDPAVRRAVYMALGRINTPGAADVIVNGLQFDKGTDDYLRDGLIRALESTGKDGIVRLRALADSGSDTDLARVVEVYPSLRIREAAEKIPVLLQNYHIKPGQKIALIRSYRY